MDPSATAELLGFVFGAAVAGTIGVVVLLRRGQHGRAAAVAVVLVAVVLIQAIALLPRLVPAEDPEALFAAMRDGCVRACGAGGSPAERCERVCACTADGLRRGRTHEEVEALVLAVSRRHDPDAQAVVGEIAVACAAEVDGAATEPATEQAAAP